MISEYVAARQASGDSRPMQEIAVEYNDKMIYPDKVRLNCYYYRHYSFVKDIQMIVCYSWLHAVTNCGDFFFPGGCAVGLFQALYRPSLNN